MINVWLPRSLSSIISSIVSPGLDSQAGALPPNAHGDDSTIFMTKPVTRMTAKAGRD